MPVSTKLLRPFVAGAAVCVMALTAQTVKAEGVRTILDGRSLTFDVAPVVENERTLVPMRLLLEPLGATVQWDQATQTATARLNGKEVRVTQGSNTAYVNGRPTPLDVTARPVGGRTFIPLRFVSENLGVTVHWDQADLTIYVIRPSAVVAKAQSLVGTPYGWGGTSPDTGFDCSGFAYYLGKLFGAPLPRTSYDQFGAGTAVARADLQAGDLVFFTTYQAGASHVGIYDGQGHFIHAQNETTGVKVTDLSNPWWATRYVGARRVFR